MKKATSLLILTFLSFLLFGCNKQPEETELGVEDYCVEWSGWIHLESMVYNCYDFEKSEFRCLWEVLDNTSLLVVDYNNRTRVGVHPCSRAVKSFTLKQSEVTD